MAYTPIGIQEGVLIAQSPRFHGFEIMLARYDNSPQFPKSFYGSPHEEINGLRFGFIHRKNMPWLLNHDFNIVAGKVYSGFPVGTLEDLLSKRDYVSFDEYLGRHRVNIYLYTENGKPAVGGTVTMHPFRTIIDGNTLPNAQDSLREIIVDETSGIREILGDNYEISIAYEKLSARYVQVSAGIEFGYKSSRGQAQDLFSELAGKLNAVIPAYEIFLRFPERNGFKEPPNWHSIVDGALVQQVPIRLFNFFVKGRLPGLAISRYRGLPQDFMPCSEYAREYAKEYAKERRLKAIHSGNIRWLSKRGFTSPLFNFPFEDFFRYNNYMIFNKQYEDCRMTLYLFLKQGEPAVNGEVHVRTEDLLVNGVPGGSIDSFVRELVLGGTSEMRRMLGGNFEIAAEFSGRGRHFLKGPDWVVSPYVVFTIENAPKRDAGEVVSELTDKVNALLPVCRSFVNSS